MRILHGAHQIAQVHYSSPARPYRTSIARMDEPLSERFPSYADLRQNNLREKCNWGLPVLRDGGVMLNSDLGFNRRKLLIGTAALGASAILANACSENPQKAAQKGSAQPLVGTLNLYTWPEFFAPESLKKFTEQTGITVNVTTFTSEDVLFAKLNVANGGGFDVATVTGHSLPLLARNERLAKLDTTRLPMANLDPSLLGQAFDPENTYSVPKDYGSLGYLYNPAVAGADMSTWADFYRACSKPGVSRKVDFGGSLDAVFASAFMADGTSLQSEDPAAVDKAIARVKSVARHIRQFNGYDDAGLTSGAIVLALVDNGTARRVINQGAPLKWVLPKPRAQLYVDNYCILKASTNLERAYAFLTWQLQPQQMIADSEATGYAHALPSLADKLPAAVKYKEIMIPSAEELQRLDPWIVRPAIQQRLAEALEEIKAAAGG